MEGVLERAWNHPPLDKCLELVEDSTERSTRGVTERWARGFLLLRLTECTKRDLSGLAYCTSPQLFASVFLGRPSVTAVHSGTTMPAARSACYCNCRQHNVSPLCFYTVTQASELFASYGLRGLVRRPGCTEKGCTRPASNILHKNSL